ncbi:MAG: hypothetical protein WD749_14895 [Phycisphaerales bacterium]
MRKRPWLKFLPFTRVGLLLVIGSLTVSAFRYYVAFMQQAADLDSKTMPEDRDAALSQFLNGFLFSGSVAGILFWLGLGLMMFGAIWRLYWHGR